MTGSVLAAFVLTSLQEFLRFLKDYRLVIYPVILILVMLFRPQGLLGMRELSFTDAFDFIKQKIKTLGNKKNKKTEVRGE